MDGIRMALGGFNNCFGTSIWNLKVLGSQDIQNS